MFNVKTHYKWPLLIAMFVYQRVNVVFFGIKLVETQRRIPWKSDSSDSWETKDVFMDSEHSISNLKIANAFFFCHEDNSDQNPRSFSHTSYVPRVFCMFLIGFSHGFNSGVSTVVHGFSTGCPG